MKGYVLTMDAVVALGLVLAVLGLLLPLASPKNADALDKIAVQRYTSDFLAVLQKSGRVDGALSGNESAITSAFIYSGQGKCFLFTATSMPAGEIVSVLSKAGCGAIGENSATTVSNEFYNGSVYEVQLTGWIS